MPQPAAPSQRTWAQLTAARRLGPRDAFPQPRSGLMLLQALSESRARGSEQTAENGIQEQMQMNDQSSRSFGARPRLPNAGRDESKALTAVFCCRSAGYPNCLRGKRISVSRLLGFAVTGIINVRVCRVARTGFHAAKAKTEPPPVV